METYEQSFVRALLRNTHESLQFGNFKEVAARLKEAHPAVDHEEAVKYVRGQTASLKHPVLMTAAIRLFITNRSAVMALLEERGEHSAASYLASIMIKISGKPGDSGDRPGIADIVFRNWRQPFTHAHRTLPTGVYQMFRRYKPRANETREGDTDESSLAWVGEHDVIVCELLYLDSEAMECVLVTSEGSVYWGSLYINHNMTLYGLLQRPNTRSDEKGVSQRLYAINIKPSGGKKLSVYSGLYIKSGDITERPLSGESVISRVPLVENEELWGGLRDLFKTEWSEMELAPEDPIMEYVSGFDEDGQSHVSRISDFPLLSNIAEPNSNDLVLFREPSRALDSLVLTNRSKKHPLPVFRRKP